MLSSTELTLENYTIKLKPLTETLTTTSVSTWWIAYVLHKGGKQTLDSQNPHKWLGGMMVTCNPGAWEAQVGDPWGQLASKTSYSW